MVQDSFRDPDDHSYKVEWEDVHTEYTTEGTNRNSICGIVERRWSKLGHMACSLVHLPFNQIERMQKCATGVQVKELPIHDDDDQYDACAGCAKGKLLVNYFPSRRSTRQRQFKHYR